MPDQDSPDDLPNGWADRLIGRVTRFRKWCGQHPLALVVPAAALLIGVLVPGIIRYRHLHLHAHPWLLAAALAVVPAMVVFNVLEFAVIGLVAGRRVGQREAITVGIGGSIANLLPIPGSIVLRTGALVSAGSALSSTLAAIAQVGFVWIGITASALGAAATPRDPALGGAILAAGLVLTAGGVWLVRRQRARVGSRRLLLAVVAVEAGTVLVDSLRIWLVLHAIGAHGGVLDAVALTSASVVTTASGIFPAGLGLREALSAAFAAASGLPAAVGVTTSVVDRLVVLAGIGVISGVSAAWMRGHRSAGIRSAG